MSVLLQHTDTFSLSELKIGVSLNTSLCKGKKITLRFVIKNRKKKANNMVGNKTNKTDFFPRGIKQYT